MTFTKRRASTRINRCVNAFESLELRTLLSTGGIQGKVWIDLDQDGVQDNIQDTGEYGKSGVVVQLYSSTDNTVDDSDPKVGADHLTDSSGVFSFSGLAAGSYFVKVILPNYHAFTLANIGSDETKDSDVNTTTGRTGILSVSGGSAITNVGAGLIGDDASFGSAQKFSSTENDKVTNMDIDSSGNLIIGGVFGGALDFDLGAGTTTKTPIGQTVYVAKYTSANDLVWAVDLANTSGASSEIAGLQVDSSGNVYVAGLFTGEVDFDPGVGENKITAVGKSDVFLLKLNSTGGLVWVKTVGTDNVVDTATDLAMDATGKVYILGNIGAQTDVDPGAGETLFASGAFLAAFDADGAQTWALPITGTATSVALNSTQAFVIGSQLTMVSIVNGSENDVLTFTKSDGAAFSMTSIIADANSITVAGYFSGTVDFDPGAETSNLTANSATENTNDGFIFKYNLNSTLQWVKQFKGTNGQILPTGMTVNEAGDIFMVGTLISGSFDLNPGDGTRTIASDNGSLFVAILNSSGDYVTAYNMVKTTTDGRSFSSRSIAVGEDNVIILTGSFQGSVDFDHTLTQNVLAASNSSIDGVVLKLNPVASVAGQLWLDDDNDGVKDAGESYASGATVKIYDTTDGVVGSDTLVFTTTTDVDGKFKFENLNAGFHYVSIVSPTGYVFAGITQIISTGSVRVVDRTDVFDLTSTQNLEFDPFGLKPAVDSIGDLVWADTDEDGMKDDGEIGVNGVLVSLYDPVDGLINDNDVLIATTTSDSNGAWSIANFAPGSYYLRFTAADGNFYTYSPKTNATDNVVDPATHATAILAFAANDALTDIDVGLKNTTTISGTVFNDIDRDGIRDAGETLAPGVSVKLMLFSNDTQVGSTVITDSSGNYSFSKIDLQNYYVLITLPSGLTFSSKDQGSNPSLDSDVDATGKSIGLDTKFGQVYDVDAAIHATPAGIKAYLASDSMLPGKVSLRIEGTSGADTFKIAMSGSKVVLTYKNSPAGTFAVTGRIVIKTLAGNDKLTVTSSNFPIWAFGGDGNDSLMGGAKNDILVGGNGNDSCSGGSGRDLLFGDAGKDSLLGGASDDILVGSTWKYSATESSLYAVYKEWSGSSSYTTRINHLTKGGGLNGSTLIASTKITKDNLADVLNGSTGYDLYAYEKPDVLTGKISSELWK